MPVLTVEGLRLASQVAVGDKVWNGSDWSTITGISNNASARFYDYDFGTATFRANAAARIWQPGAFKCPAQLYTLSTALGPEGECAKDAAAEWDGYFWAVGDWMDSLNRPCAKELDKERVKLLTPNASIASLRGVHVHRDTRIPKKSYDKRALIPSVYMHAEPGLLRAFLRGYVIAKGTEQGSMELSSERHACTMQLALNAVGIETERNTHWLRFPNTVKVNRVMGTKFTEREETVTGQLKAVLAKGELKCFSWDVDACWMSGVILQN